MMFARIVAVLALLIGVCCQAWGQPALTTISDVLFKADGTRFNGLVQISWTSFEGGNQSNIPQQTTTVRIIDGNLYVRLTPTTNAVPAAYYTVKYSSDGRIQFSEFWTVPTSPTPLRVRDVRTTAPLFPGTGGENAVGQIQESDVIGLVADLAARPVKGPAYANGRAAMINDSGQIDAVEGGLSDCVHVDGTAGPCGSGGAAGPSFAFADSQTPSGTMNGTNMVFTLPSTPLPTASLMLFRNGVLKKQNVDYTLSTATVTFTSVAPIAGDVLVASYRIAGTSGTINFIDNQVPTGTVNGSNAVFTVTNAPAPAASLAMFRNGVLQKAGTDYTLTGASVQFVTASIPQAGDILLASYRY